MARPKKDIAARVHDAIPGPASPAPDNLAARIRALEVTVKAQSRAIGILADYIIERDQLRYVGPTANIAGLAREFPIQ